jgi:hypothetical protein
VLQELFGGVELAVLAGVVEGNVAVRAFFAKVDFAGVEGLGVDVDADRALVEFGEIEDLMDGLERVDVGGMGSVHFVNFGGDDAAGAVGSVAIVHAKVLDLQAADGGGHPTILAAVIVDAAGLANFPADGHAFEDFVFEDEVAGVVALGIEAVFFESVGTDGVAEDVVLNVFEGEVALGDGGEAFHPIGDGELFGCKFLRHQKPPRAIQVRRDCRRIIAHGKRSQGGK